jgi:hypothetical protein
MCYRGEGQKDAVFGAASDPGINGTLERLPLVVEFSHYRQLGFRRGFLAEQGIYLLMRDVHPLGGCHALEGLMLLTQHHDALLDQQVQLA